MQIFTHKTAVITGAASGIGRALAEYCAQQQMQVVIADIEEKALAETEQALQAQGAKVIAVPTDVSKAQDVINLAEITLKTFKAVHLLFNNAGVVPSGGSTIWKSQVADWEWSLGVNLWGVIHGLQTFVPIMLRQDCECHIINTASMAGLISYEPMVTYHVSKHAIIALSEHLYHTLAQQKAKVKASVLCPGWVKTSLLNAERNRPQSLQVNRTMTQASVLNKQEVERNMEEQGVSAERIAEMVFEAIRSNKFYIITHPELKDLVQQRMQDILNDRNPTKIAIGH